MMTAVPLLSVRDLTVEFSTRRGTVRAVEKVDLSVARGETLGIVGESGSGKSVTSYAVMRILDRAGKIAEGSVVFSGIDLSGADEAAMRDLRGSEISMVFQNLRAALNPIRKVGRQIEDVLLQHVKAAPSEAAEKAIAMLQRVRIARPRERYHSYPFELSGGMCQRSHCAGACLYATITDRGRADHRPRRHDPKGGDRVDDRAHARARHGDDPNHA